MSTDNPTFQERLEAFLDDYLSEDSGDDNDCVVKKTKETTTRNLMEPSGPMDPFEIEELADNGELSAKEARAEYWRWYVENCM